MNRVSLIFRSPFFFAPFLAGPGIFAVVLTTTVGSCRHISALYTFGYTFVFLVVAVSIHGSKFCDQNHWGPVSALPPKALFDREALMAMHAL